MITCKLGANLLALAKEQAEEMGRLNNSITGGEGNTAGFVGELLTANLLGAEQANTYEYDLVLPDGKTVDVKTKRTTSTPKPHYECSVAALNTRQQCDYYAFVRVGDSGFGWFLGLVEKQAYFAAAHFLRKGDVVDTNNFVVRSDCYNLTIKDVWEMSKHDTYFRR